MRLLLVEDIVLLHRKFYGLRDLGLIVSATNRTLLLF